MAFSLFGLFNNGGKSAPNPVTLNMYELAAANELARATAIAQRWRAYHGQHPKPLKVRQGQPDDNIIINYARIIVDKGVSFLFGTDVAFALDDNDLEETAPEQWLNACWRYNRKMTLLQKLALNGAIAGHAFVKIVPAADARSFPRLVVLDPSSVTVTWDPDDIEDVTGYKIQYNSKDPNTGKPVFIRQLIERDDAGLWTITDQRSNPDSASWVTLGQSTWPYPWPPVIDCQNMPCPNEFYGISDLEDDILALIAAINFVSSNIARILRHHAHPKTWGKGFAASQLSIAVDETIILPTPEATLQNLEMSSDLGSSIAMLQRLREALFEIARVPEVATGRLESIGNLSGTALQILYQPLIEKTETKRRTYGDMLVELNRRLLSLAGFGDDNYTTIHWPELIPGDPETEARTLLVWQQLGVSRDTILQKLGLNPDTERQKREADNATLGDHLLSAFEKGQGLTEVQPQVQPQAQAQP